MPLWAGGSTIHLCEVQAGEGIQCPYGLEGVQYICVKPRLVKEYNALMGWKGCNTFV